MSFSVRCGPTKRAEVYIEGDGDGEPLFLDWWFPEKYMEWKTARLLKRGDK